jgi:2-alkyl-3-oxoalkanoate reductase
LNRRIAITGASGFIGGQAAKRLTRAGYSISCLGRAQLQHPGEHLSGVWGVLHCAGKAGAWGRYDEYYSANVELTERLLKAAKTCGVRRFVNLSSPSIYFDYKHQLGLSEQFLPRRFSNAYAKTKYLAEQRVRGAHSEHFETVSLRPRGVVGEGDTNWLPRIIELRKSGSLKQVGSGPVLANFTSISNLLDAIELCFCAPPSAMGETYNIHNGVEEDFWQVVEKALELNGLDGQRKHVPLRMAMLLAKANAVWNRILRRQKEPALLPIKVGVSAYSLTMDISKARQRLGYAPRQSTHDALAEWRVPN